MPALFRVHDPTGAPVERVQITGVMEPSGRRLQRMKITAAGLCLLSWPKSARRLRLTLTAGGASADVEGDARRPDPDRVIHVQLSEG